MRNLSAVFVALLLASACQKPSAWQGGLPSPEALGVAIVEALNRGDAAKIDALVIGKAEYQQLLWPEFPNAKNGSGISPEDAWTFHEMNLAKHKSRALSDWGRRDLKFRRLGWARDEDYKNFHLKRDVVLEVETPDGQIEQITALGSIVEYNNSYRLLTFKDS